MPSKRILDIRRPEKNKAARQSRTRARALMTPLFPQKSKRLKARRRRKRIIVFCVCLLCAAGLVGGAGFASHTERLAIKDVSITGTETLSADALVAAVSNGLDTDLLKIFSGRNMFLYQRNTIEGDLVTAFPRIKKVELSRPALLAQAVVVAVEERQPFAKWCLPAQAGSDEACFVLDESGFLFAPMHDEDPQTSYVFRGGLIPEQLEVGQFFLQGRFRGVVRFLDALSEAGYEARSVRVENEKDFSITLANGIILLVPFEADVDALRRNFTLALEADVVRGREDELEYVDLRFGNRVYYKFKGE